LLNSIFDLHIYTCSIHQNVVVTKVFTMHNALLFLSDILWMETRLFTISGYFTVRDYRWTKVVYIWVSSYKD